MLSAISSSELPARAPRSLPWLVLQLADSAFPIGGFAHSAGLEAAIQSGEVRTSEPDELGSFCRDLIVQTGSAALPFVNSGHAEPAGLAEIDSRCDSFLSNHIANRASRVQGRALLSTCLRSFELPEIRSLDSALRKAQSPSHFAPLFGAISSVLRISRDDARQVFMFQTLRGALSAAVRMNAIGTYSAQNILARLVPLMDEVLDRSAHLSAGQAAQTAPLLDLCQMGHDRLYSRLFLS